MRAAVFALLALLVVGSACGGGEELPTAEGVVIGVDGGLTDVQSFTIRTTDGSDLTFQAPDDLLFHGSGPLGHLRSHLTSGVPVIVTYEARADGSLAAIEVDDAPGS